MGTKRVRIENPYENLMLEVDLVGNCWVSKRVDRQGYSQVGSMWAYYPGHRLVYAVHNGPMPEGLTIDHLCRNRACINPEHLEVVTNKVNVLRGEAPSAQYARQTHCLSGHEYTPETTHYYGPNKTWRSCRLCAMASYFRNLPE